MSWLNDYVYLYLTTHIHIILKTWALIYPYWQFNVTVLKCFLKTLIILKYSNLSLVFSFSITVDFYIIVSVSHTENECLVIFLFSVLLHSSFC